MEIVRTENLTKWYGNGPERLHALQGVTLSVEEGEFVSIVGPSGSGKSTLLHLLGAVDQPSVGEVFLEGERLYGRSERKLAILRRRKLGMVFQFFNLLPGLTVEENILLPLLLDGRRQDPAELEALLQLLGLQDRRNHLPSQLSGGQQQRAALGRALIYKPSLVLADEPTGNLDSRTSREMVDLLKTSCRRYGRTLIMVTHDRELACEADRIISIEDGRLERNRRIR